MLCHFKHAFYLSKVKVTFWVHTYSFPAILPSFRMVIIFSKRCLLIWGQLAGDECCGSGLCQPQTRYIGGQEYLFENSFHGE